MAKFKKKPSPRRRSPSTASRYVDDYLHDAGVRPRMVADMFWDHLQASYGEQADIFQSYVERRRTADKADSAYGDDVEALYRLKNASLDFSIALSSQYMGRMYSSFLAMVTSLGLNPQANAVLDLGCDNGLLTAFYAMYFTDATVVGVDKCEEAIACANALKERLRLANLTFVAADAFQDLALPELPLNKWDVVFMTLCGYEEVDRHPDTERQVASRFHSYLKPKGIGVVVEYPNSPILTDLLILGGRSREWSLSYELFGGDTGSVVVAEIEAHLKD